MSNAYDALRGQILLQQCAIDLLLSSHPDRDTLAQLFLLSSAELVTMMEREGFEREAVDAVKQMRQSMLRRLGRTEH